MVGTGRCLKKSTRTNRRMKMCRPIGSMRQAQLRQNPRTLRETQHNPQSSAYLTQYKRCRFAHLRNNLYLTSTYRSLRPMVRKNPAQHTAETGSTERKLVGAGVTNCPELPNNSQW